MVTVLTAIAVTGCAAGQRAQTSTEFSVVDGVSADVSTIGLRDLGIAAPVTGTPSYPRAGSAPLVMGIVNNGRAPDTLVSVSSPAASGTTITAPTATTTAAVTRPAGGSSPGVSSSAPAPSAPAPSGPAGAQIEIPASKLVRISTDQGSAGVTLTGLKNPLVPGQSVSVTFTFRTAGTVTVQVAVKLPVGQTGGETVVVSPSGN